MPKGVYPHHPIYKTKSCVKCGTSLEASGPRHEYCPECRLENKRRQGREANRRARESGYGYEPCPECGRRKQVNAKLCDRCHRAFLSANPELHPGWKGGK